MEKWVDGSNHAYDDDVPGTNQPVLHPLPTRAYGISGINLGCGRYQGAEGLRPAQVSPHFWQQTVLFMAARSAISGAVLAANGAIYGGDADGDGGAGNPEGAPGGVYEYKDEREPLNKEKFYNPHVMGQVRTTPLRGTDAASGATCYALPSTDGAMDGTVLCYLLRDARG